MALAPHYRFPRGWFLATSSDELACGKILSLKYFDKDLIAYRTETGRAVILDAHCPHLGAHIGIGGKVEGEAVRCPFHGWLYNSEGQCVQIPYSESGKIPQRAKLRHWQVEEKDGGVFFWHDPEGLAPDYQLPDNPQYDDIDWIPWQLEKRIIYTQPKEVVDNITDKAHFPVVHHSPVKDWVNEFDGHCAVQKQDADHLQTVATYHGPAYLLTTLQQAEQESIMLVCHTPIDETAIHIWSGVMVKMENKQRDKKACEQAANYASFLNGGFLEDVAIWEHKAPADNPILCEGDGPIVKGRHWYDQFYQPRKKKRVDS